MDSRILTLLLAPLALSSLSCATAGRAPVSPAPVVVVGTTTREAIEAAVPEWVQAVVDAQPDTAVAQSLTAVEPGAEVTVFLGTWCGDSRREVPRFWRVLDEVGGLVPFEIHYIGVDREKKEPAGQVTAEHILYVPTFIVRRNGKEVGRIVEHSPGGLETDLLALLTGKAEGLLTTRTDLSPGGSGGAER